MKRMIKYPSIEQFRTVLKNINDRSAYIGKDEDGNPMFDYLRPKPTVTFTASEKIHGTNASVCYSIPDGIWAQSRENIITVEKDNAGFAFFVEQNKGTLINLIEVLSETHDIDLSKNIISLYGEWAGGNIQKNSALSGCEKQFIIFQAFKVSPLEPSEDEKAVWFETCEVIRPGNSIYVNWIDSTENRIFNIMNFNQYSFTFDFNSPEKTLNEIINLVQDVIEPASPLGKKFGQDENVGEGVVCTYLSDDGALIQFKVKGEKHSNSKVKTTAPVDLEKLGKVDKCVEEITHNWRFEQGLVTIFGSDYEKNINRNKMGDYLKWVASDTLKEESDIIVKYGFEPKDVMGKVQDKAKKYFYAAENSSLN
mgnify:CR=1 FL=1